MSSSAGASLAAASFDRQATGTPSGWHRALTRWNRGVLMKLPLVMHEPYHDEEPEVLSRAQLGAIVESSDDVIVSKTLDGTITSWNPAAERLFGWTAAEAIGRHIMLIIPEDRRVEEEDVLARIRHGERVDHFETVRLTKDGRLVDMSITVSPVKDGAGRIVGASKVARDITERRKGEIAMRRLAAIVDSSDDVIVSKTLNGIITSWNPAAERLFGWTAAEAIGRHIMLIVPEDRRAEEEDVLARIRQGERVDHFETVRRTKDGRLVDMSITVSPLKDAAGHVVGASKVARDITERRRLEDQRTLLLAREQEARQQAEALNSAKDELLATVSHELRTPLNAIFGWARMIQSGALETVRPAAGAKDITLVAAFDRSLGAVEGAPDRLQQVVWNLLMNSVKFTPAGGRVEISSLRAAGSLVITVSDTGRGIAAEVLPHVFELFRQEDSSSTRAQGGLGLGLTLVRRLVELHGGEVIAQSPGKDRGATFTVTLPVSRQKVPTEAGDARQMPDGTRVLVVDDDPEFLDLTATVLRRAGAQVRAVSSAAQAYELVNSWLPDVVLADLAMPDEDGFMLGRAMRAIFSKQRAHVAIIALTAYGTPDSHARAIQAGFDLYLTKPVDPVELAGAVAGVIRRPI